jgi:hypothetical protein
MTNMDHYIDLDGRDTYVDPDDVLKVYEGIDHLELHFHDGSSMIVSKQGGASVQVQDDRQPQDTQQA